MDSDDENALLKEFTYKLIKQRKEKLVLMLRICDFVITQDEHQHEQIVCLCETELFANKKNRKLDSYHRKKLKKLYNNYRSALDATWKPPEYNEEKDSDSEDEHAEQSYKGNKQVFPSVLAAIVLPPSPVHRPATMEITEEDIEPESIHDFDAHVNEPKRKRSEFISDEAQEDILEKEYQDMFDSEEASTSTHCSLSKAQQPNPAHCNTLEDFLHTPKKQRTHSL
nr:TPA_asm: small T antigen [Swordtail adomavirus 1]